MYIKKDSVLAIASMLPSCGKVDRSECVLMTELSNLFEIHIWSVCSSTINAYSEIIDFMNVSRQPLSLKFAQGSQFLELLPLLQHRGGARFAKPSLVAAYIGFSTIAVLNHYYSTFNNTTPSAGTLCVFLFIVSVAHFSHTARLLAVPSAS
jgi:hypothetical protein